MIRQVSPNHMQAVTATGTVVASAHRRNPGTVWYVNLAGHTKAPSTRNQTPHVRISGKLPEIVQRKLIIAAMTATTGVIDTPWVAR